MFFGRFLLCICVCLFESDKVKIPKNPESCECGSLDRFLLHMCVYRFSSKNVNHKSVTKTRVYATAR